MAELLVQMTTAQNILVKYLLGYVLCYSRLFIDIHNSLSGCTPFSSRTPPPPPDCLLHVLCMSPSSQTIPRLPSFFTLYPPYVFLLNL